MRLVADNLNIVDPRVARALDDRDPAPIRELVRRCAASGAQLIDINSGPLPRDSDELFTFLVDTVQSACDLPLVLDSTNPHALKAGLEACRRRPVINGFSLEPERLARVLPLARRYEADIVGFVLHPDSRVPIEEDEMMALAVSLFEVYSAAGLPPERLIIDPVVAPLSWEKGMRHNRALLALIRNLADLLDAPVRTMAGLSNLTSGRASSARKSAVETAFVPMLAAAGLDFLLLNLFHAPAVRAARTCNLLLQEGIFTWAAIAEDPHNLQS
jgi:5-methyltetrahydrofolate corrinoid/iron sulfur protein methyltransferase